MDENNKNKHCFNIKYEKNSHSLEAETYATTLVSINRLLREINYSINPAGGDISLSVIAENRGSFDVLMEISSFITENQTVIAAVIQTLPQIVSIALQIIQLKIQLKDKNPDNQKTIINGDNVEIRDSNNVTICKTNYTIYNLFNKNQVVDDAISEQFKAIEKDNEIQSVSFTNNDEKVVINREEFQYLSKKRIVTNDESEITNESVTLVISKLNLEHPHAKWGFIYNGTSINAYIEDAIFWERTLDGDEMFARGDRLLCNMQVKREFDNNLGVFLNKEYTIIKVMKHVRQPKKISMDIQ